MSADKHQATADQIIIELAGALGKERALTDRESRWLERALWRVDGYNRRQSKRWTEDDARLRKMLIEGQRPAQIAVKLKRTPRAIYRRMYKLRLTKQKSSVVPLRAAE